MSVNKWKENEENNFSGIGRYINIAISERPIKSKSNFQPGKSMLSVN